VRPCLSKKLLIYASKKLFKEKTKVRIKKLNFLIEILLATWDLLVDASVYILFGLLVAGLLRVFLNPNSIAKHLGQGRFKSVIKAAFFGIPIPL
jgi:uncharacterized membrane protein YraQ (UPF0718 family)